MGFRREQVDRIVEADAAYDRARKSGKRREAEQAAAVLQRAESNASGEEFNAAQDRINGQ